MGVKMLKIKSELKGHRVDVSIWGNTYGDRFNIKHTGVVAENFYVVDEITEKDLNDIEYEVFWQISDEEGEWFDRFTELAVENGFSEICVVGKY